MSIVCILKCDPIQEQIVLCNKKYDSRIMVGMKTLFPESCFERLDKHKILVQGNNVLLIQGLMRLKFQFNKTVQSIVRSGI